MPPESKTQLADAVTYAINKYIDYLQGLPLEVVYVDSINSFIRITLNGNVEFWETNSGEWRQYTAANIPSPQIEEQPPAKEPIENRVRVIRREK